MPTIADMKSWHCILASLVTAFVILVSCCDDAGNSSAAKPDNAVNPDNELSYDVFIDDANFNDFIDNTSRYKGKRVGLHACLDSLGYDNGKPISLRNRTDNNVRFYNYHNDTRLNLEVLINPGVPVPKAVIGDAMTIVIYCGEGSLDVGNKAIKVLRLVQ